MITIDGRIGGGSIVRLAVGLSAATQQPVHLTNIRQHRPKPGIRPQHRAGIEAVAGLCDAVTEGCEVGSQELVFDPGSIRTENVSVTVPTAGAVSLVLQPLQIAATALDHPIRIRIDGGATAGKWAPPLTTVQQVTLPILERAGAPATITVQRHGFYPQGGALVDADIGPVSPQPFDLADRGELEQITGVSIASTHLQEAEVAERQRQEARRVIKNQHPSIDVDIETRYVETRSPGSCITLAADCGNTVLGADALGEKGKRAQIVGNEAAAMLCEEIGSGAAVDTMMSDQLIPFLGLHGGRARIRAFTDHVKSNIAVVEQFLDTTFERDENLLQC